MAFLTNMTGTGAVDDSIVTAFASEAYIAATQKNVVDALAFTRMDIGAKSISLPSFTPLTVSTTPLVETDDVTPEALVDGKILITPAEYGKAVVTTQLASFQTGGLVDRVAAKLVGENVGATLDKLGIAALNASTNVMTPTGAAVGSLSATNDVMSRVFLNRLRNKLERANVPTFSNGLYALVVHPDVMADLRADASAGSFIDVVKGSVPELALLNNIAMYMGFFLIPDSNVPVSAATVKGYTALALGGNALGKVVSQDVQVIAKPTNDLLNRFVSVGWRATLAYSIMDQNAVWKGVTSSGYAA